jgi:hypothetical protein
MSHSVTIGKLGYMESLLVVTHAQGMANATSVAGAPSAAWVLASHKRSPVCAVTAHLG